MRKETLSTEVLTDYRSKIDDIDNKLLSLLEERMKLVQEVAELKKSSHLSVIDFKREKSILDRLSYEGKGILPMVTLQNIYREILGASRSCQTAAMLPHEKEELPYFLPRLCLSIMENENEKVIDSLVFPGADLVEWRLDATSCPDVPGVLSHKEVPMICTNRNRETGGFFDGTEKERIELLSQAALHGSDFIDIEYTEGVSELLDSFPSDTQIILSYHDFEKTPPEEDLFKLAEKMSSCGVFLIKIVTAARTPDDCLLMLRLIRFLREKDQEVIAFCMGPTGKWTRIGSLFLGAYLTYGASSPEKLAAPGQLTIPQIRHLLSMLC